MKLNILDMNRVLHELIIQTTNSKMFLHIFGFEICKPMIRRKKKICSSFLYLVLEMGFYYIGNGC